METLFKVPKSAVAKKKQAHKPATLRKSKKSGLSRQEERWESRTSCLLPIFMRRLQPVLFASVPLGQ